MLRARPSRRSSSALPGEQSERRRAFQLRDTVSAYDAAYVVLADALDCPLLTRDVALRRAAGSVVRIELR